MTHTNLDTYGIVSNEESINKFLFATQVLDVVVEDTSMDTNNDVSMTIKFKKPLSIGSGVASHYEIILNNDLTNPIRVEYSDDDDEVYEVLSHSVVNKAISYQGEFTVYLVTKDTNSPFENKNGKPIVTSYVVAGLILDDIDYQVYSSTDSNQNMHLSWTSPVDSSSLWRVTDYAVLKKVGTEDYSVVSDSDTLLGRTYTYDSSGDASDATLTFKIIATVEKGLESYTIESEPKSINKFSFATPVLNVVVESTSIDTTVSMTVKFDAPLDKGPGTPLNYQILVHTNGVLKDTIPVTYEDKPSFVVNILNNSNLLYQGDVTVRLVTRDTNDTDFRTNEKNGALSASVPYVAANILLSDVDYLVYSDNSQNMNLSWSDPLPTANPWSVSRYIVLKKVGTVGPYQEVTDPLVPLTSESFSYDSSGDISCGTLYTFKIEATLTHSTTSYTYTITSDTKEIRKFYKSEAPRQLNVLWAVTDVNKTTFDIRVTFSNPNSIGCGSDPKFCVELLDSGLAVKAKNDNIAYISSNNTYTVNFDNIAYFPNGTVKVYLSSKDNNSNNSIDGVSETSYFEVTRAPVFTYSSISSDNTSLSLQVVSANLLKLNAAYIFRNTDNMITYLNWSTDQVTSANLSVLIARLTNDEYHYTISMNSLLFNLNVFPSEFGIAVANDFGVNGTSIKTGSVQGQGLYP